MTTHAEDALAGARITQVLDLSLAVAALEAGSTKRLLVGEDCEVFDLVATHGAVVGAVVADEGAVAQQKQIGVRVEKSFAVVAAETGQVPSIAS